MVQVQREKDRGQEEWAVVRACQCVHVSACMCVFWIGKVAVEESL